MITNSKIKKWFAILLLFTLIFPIMANPIYASIESLKPIVVSNDFIEYSVNKSNARYSIRTTNGSPWKEKDSNKQLLYQNKNPETSFTTFRIDGEDYIYGNDYGFLGGDGQFILGISNDGPTNKSTWKIKGIEITQEIHLYEDETNPYVGNVKISYTVKNTNDTRKDIGSRILLDTMLGANDGSAVVLNGQSEYITMETDLTGSDVPNYWRASDDPLAPKVISYGFLDGWGNHKPDRMIIGHWNGMSETKWDYSVRKGLDFTSNKNEYDVADSAVALYWQPDSIMPGEEIKFETYYGLGNFYTTKQKANFGLQIIAPEILTLNDLRDGYVDEEFNISVEIDNSVVDARRLTNMQMSLGLTDGLELVKEEDELKTIGDLDIGEITTISWRIKAKPQEIYKASQYIITINAEGLQEEVHGGYVILPALSGEPPKVQLLNIAPEIMYYEEEDKSFTLKGQGFEVLKASNDWYIELTSSVNESTEEVPQSFITVSDDQNIKVAPDKAYWDKFGNKAGPYTVHLYTEDYGEYEREIILTKDKTYKSRDYNILLVVGKNISSDRIADVNIGKETYEIVTITSEEELENIKAQLSALNNESYFEDDNQVLLEFKGEVKAYGSGEDKQYNIAPGAYINSVIEYSTNDTLKFLYGEASQTITIEEIEGENKSINIQGNGVLSIPGFPFVQGAFKIELENGTRYSLDYDKENEDDNPIEIKWDVLEGLKYLSYVGIFPVKFKNAIIGDKAVSFGGSAYLNIGGKLKKDKKDDNSNNKKDDDSKDYDDPFRESSSIGIDIDELKFGYREHSSIFGTSGQYGFIGLRAEGSAGMPKDMIPGLNLGAEGRVLVDTMENIYEVEVDVSFKVVEFYGLISLRFIDGKIPIPDSLVGAVGTEPGIPIIPSTPIVYITKGGLGFENLYDTVTGNFNVFPPLKLMFTGSVDLLKVLQGNDITLEISPREISLSGDLTIANFDILKNIHGKITLIDNGLGIYAEIGGGIDVFDIIVGEAAIGGGIDSNYSGIWGPVVLYGKIDVQVQVPSVVPVFGGYSLVGVEGEVNTKGFSISPSVLGIPMLIEYAWGDSEASFDVGAASSNLYLRDEGIMQKTYFNEETGEIEGTLTYGRNITKIASSKDKMYAFNSDMSSLGIEKPIIISELNKLNHKINIDNKDAIIFEIEYEGEVPNIEVHDPEGNLYNLIENENYRVQVLSAEESQSGFEEKKIYITAVNPIDGDWVIESDKPVDVVLLNAEIPPSFTSISVEQMEDNHKFKTAWQGEHAENTKIALYLCKDNQEDVGLKIIDDIDFSEEYYEYTLPDSLASGDYYIKAVLYKGDINYDSMYSENDINIIDDYQPATPENLQIESVGNGILKVKWEQEQEVDGYIIEIKDENDNSVGTIDVEGDLEESYIGGSYEDKDGNLLGMIPGKTYIINVTAYKNVDDINHYSDKVTSEPINLPNPQPPVLSFDVDTDEGIVKVNEDIDGNKTYIVNNSQIDLGIQSDQHIEADILLNSEEIMTVEGVQINEEIELNEGENFIQFNSVNDNGDTAIDAITINCDTKAPELKVDNIEKIWLEDQEKIRIKGATELGSIITVNESIVEVDDEGVFETYLLVGNKIKKEIVVISEDEAGNVTNYTSTFINEDVKEFNRVEIRANNSTTIEGYIGEELQLELYVIDKDEVEYLIDSGDVKWSLLLGEGAADISEDGVLSIRQVGDIIVKASYFVSKEYAFEDAVMVNIEEESQGDDSSGDFNPFPKEDKKDDDVDKKLQRVLRKLIENEGNLAKLKDGWISGRTDTKIRVDKNTRITIPKQYLEAKIGFGVWKVKNTFGYENNNITLLSDIYEIVLNQDHSLEKPAVLEIKYDPNKIENIEDMAIYWFNEDKDRWEYVGGTVNKEEHTIFIELNHFSKYSVLKNSGLTKLEDIKGRWSEDIIYRLVSTGIINGIKKGDMYYYQPSRHISRQEFLKLLVKGVGLNPNSTKMLNGYMDIQNIHQWAMPYVNEAVNRKWLTGVKKSDGTYIEPLREITRAEAAVMVGRMLNSMNHEEKNENLETSFTDKDDIPEWAKIYIKTLNNNKIIQGYPDKTFKPYKPITREEAASIISKLMDYINSKQ